MKLLGVAATVSGVPSTTIRPPFTPTAGAKIDHPVGGLDDVEIMLDHHDGIAVVGETVEDLEELAYVLEVEASGRLVENVERLSSGAAGEFLRELDALRFAAAQASSRVGRP